MKYLHTMVRVTDLEASLKFYRDALGLEVLRIREVPQGRFTLAFLAAPGDHSAQIELTHNWDPETYTGGRNFGHLAYLVDDIYLFGLLSFSISHVVSADEADRIVAATELMGYRDEAPGIATPPGMRMNKSVHWVADEALLGTVMARIGHLLPPDMLGAPLYPYLSHRLNMYRYDAQDVFNRHTDGDWPGYGLSEDRNEMLEWPGLRSGLTMLLYLNGPEDGVVGGNTRLYRRDGSWVDVVPKKGDALFFRHGFGPSSVVHEGRRVESETPKYVARINVMFGRTSDQPL